MALLWPVELISSVRKAKLIKKEKKKRWLTSAQVYATAARKHLVTGKKRGKRRRGED